MAIQTTRWSPDTCGCTVEYTWDDTVPADWRVHTYLQHSVDANGNKQKCSSHQSLTDSDTYTAITRENPSRNNLKGVLLSTFAALQQTYTDPDGNSWIDFKRGLEPVIAWETDPTQGSITRRIVLDTTKYGLTAAQKTNLQNAVAAHPRIAARVRII